MNTPEFSALEAMLRQQNEYFGERFSRLDEQGVRIETRLTAVEKQVATTNGTVLRHESALTALQTDPSHVPMLTQRDGKLLRKAVGLSVSVGTALYFAIRWLAVNWSHLAPAMFAGWVG